ncbi:MAG: DUF262 domain-containing protein [Gemmobacter sp.]|uniref:GmrSD restriction endonuclease domain-containing protein n=1 Tax=Gemmobacter sp. TaxID=1898957 RepID=UPI00391CF3E5
MSFQTNPVPLRDLLNAAHAGRLQLPDFQRSYVWGDEDVRMLVASILRGFPVGALLTLRSGGEVNFRPRLLQGVEAARKARGEGAAGAAEELLLDGQQRITSLYGAMVTPQAMVVRKPRSERQHLRRFYYLRIDAAVEHPEDIEKAVLGVPESRQRHDEVLRIDLSDREREFEEGCFPLNLAFSDAAFDWIDDYRDHWRARDAARAGRARRFRKDVLEPLRAYQMRVISLGQDTTREAVCMVFEKVNVGGKKLDAFELVTAIFAGAAEPLNLRDDWETRRARIRRGASLKGMENPVFDHLRGFDFLQGASLVLTHAARKAAEARAERELPQISCRRDALLKTELGGYKAVADRLEDGFREAGRFLNDQGILWAKDLPYPAQGVTLAAVFAIAGKAAQSAAAKDKLRLWFWRTALAEDYGLSPESKLAKDAEDLSAWLAGGPEPVRMPLLTFNPDRLDTLRNRISAAYNAFAALLLREGGRDFITGDRADILTFGNDPMDVHHIFPRKWCEDQGIDVARYDTILNKTPLTAASNRAIGGDAPSVYLNRIEAQHGLTFGQINSILRSHLIDPDLLRQNDFAGFIADRKARLAGLAARAMGLAVAAAPLAPTEPEATAPPEEEAA